MPVYAPPALKGDPGVPFAGPMPVAGLSGSVFESILARLMQNPRIVSAQRAGLSALRNAFSRGRIPERAIDILDNFGPYDPKIPWQAKKLANDTFGSSLMGETAEIRFNPSFGRELTIPHEMGHVIHRYTDPQDVIDLIYRIKNSPAYLIPGESSPFARAFVKQRGFAPGYPYGTERYRTSLNELTAELIGRKLVAGEHGLSAFYELVNAVRP